MWLCRSAQTGAALLLAGAAIMRLLGPSAAGDEFCPRWRRLWIGAWGVLLLAAVFQLLSTAAGMAELPLAQAARIDLLADVARDTHFGWIWQARMVLVAAVFVVLLCADAAAQHAKASLAVVLDGTGALLATAVLATLVAAGHAQASERQAWLLPMDVLHAAAAGAWPGGLVPLLLLLTHARRHPQLLPTMLTVTRRFSRLSVVAVGVLTLSGSFDGYALVGTFANLWTSSYGRLLVLKVALFTAMVCLGAWNKRLTEHAPLNHFPAVFPRLWRNVLTESLIAGCVVLATEALAMSAPPLAAG